MTRNHICPPDHTHGETSTCYSSHRCACAECRTAHAARCYTRRKLLAYGTWDPNVTDAGAAVERLTTLYAAGLTTSTISTLSGISSNTLRSLAERDAQSRIQRTTLDALLAVPTDLMALAEDLKVNARGARRRLQALALNGWSRRSISLHLGLPQARVDLAMRHDAIPAGVHQAIGTFFASHWAEAAPQTTRYERTAAAIARRTARDGGWHPALAWDDIDVDDAPSSLEQADIIDELAIALALAGDPVHLTRTEQQIVIRLGEERGLTMQQIADAAGVSTRTVPRRLARATPEDRS